MKRTLLVGMSIVLMFGFVLGACSKNNKEPNAGSSSVPPSSSAAAGASSASKNSTDPFGKFDPPVKVTTVRSITASMKLPAGQTYADNIWTQTLSKEFGINVDVLWAVDGTQYDQKLAVSIASGDLPDIFKVSPQQFKQLVESDSLADLSEVYAKYATDVTKNQWEGNGSIALQTGKVGNKLFALPDAASAIAGFPATFIWIRKDWMEKLNLAEPKTMQDVFAIARAFTNGDPDGNGKKDTFGLSFQKDFYGGLGIKGFANGYHAYPQSWIDDGTGRLAYGSIQPAMKKVLQDLAALYKEGVIDPEFIVKDAALTRETIYADKIGILNGPHYFGQSVHTLKVNNPKSEWVPYLIPSIDSEPAKIALNSPTLGQYVVRKGYKHPEVLVKMFNYQFKNAYSKEATQEFYDKYMYDPVDGTIQIWQLAPVFSNDSTDISFKQMIEATDAKDPARATDTTAKLLINNAAKAAAGERSLYGWTLYYPSWKLIFNEILPKHLFLNAGFYGAPTATMTDKKATLDQLEKETFSKIIMGESSINEFDTFVANWKKLGGDQITKEVNDWKQANK